MLRNKFFFITVIILAVGCGGNNKTLGDKSLRELKSDLKTIFDWYDAFQKSPPSTELIVLADSINIDFKGRLFLSETELRKEYGNSIKIKKYINKVHENDKKEIGSRPFEKNSTVKDENFFSNRTLYYIDDLKFPKYADGKIYDLFDVYKEINERTNKIQNSVDSLVFSSRYKSKDDLIIPSSMKPFLNKILEDRKLEIKKNGGEFFYEKIKDLQLSYDKPTVKNLFFYNDSKFIYISPEIFRAIYIITFNQSYDNYRLIKYNFENGYNPNLFGSGIMTKDDYYLNVKIFRDKFSSEISLLLHHEMAHIYLSKNGFPEQNELKCDCYALALSGTRPMVIGGDKQLGIYESLLQGAIKNNHPEYWNVSDTITLNKRFKVTEKLFKKKVITQRFCDSLTSVK